MRILFVMNTPGFLRYYDETVEALLARDHEVMISFTLPESRREALEILRAWPRRPEILGPEVVRDDLYADLARDLRRTLDYVRYLHPRYHEASFLRGRRRRNIAHLPGPGAWLRRRDSLPRPVVAALTRALLELEWALPSSPRVERSLEALAPDVVLVSPLITVGSPQADQVKSAAALGVPCAACIASWDNLTNKGLMREIPDRVMVWNGSQRDEAVELHRVPSERVVVTGAQPFDRWFHRAPQRTRERFCDEVGLDPDRPIVLFAGSTANIADRGEEDRLVRRWIDALRTGQGPSAQAGILVRPHPDRRGAWSGVDLEGLARVALWPPERPNSVDAEARADLFDSLFHSDAVVGVNTSAMIEAAIVGRPVLALALPGLEQAQEGTLHFRHLLPERGGFVRVARDLVEHARQLDDALERPEAARAQARRFVEHFVRPFGLEQPATPRLVAAIEALAGLRRPPPQPSVRGTALRPVLILLVLMGRWSDPVRRQRRMQALEGGLERVAAAASGSSPRLARYPRRASKWIRTRRKSARRGWVRVRD